jgi:uncharacterized protein (TIGR00251 family)
MPCYRIEPGAVVVDIRLTPKGGRDSIDGIGVLADGRAVARARVRALPENGAANQALVALVAKALGRPKSAVAIVSGTTARVKRLRIEGDPQALARTIDGWEAG